MEQLPSPAGKWSSSTKLRTDQLGSLMEGNSNPLSLLTTRFPRLQAALPLPDWQSHGPQDAKLPLRPPQSPTSACPAHRQPGEGLPLVLPP